MKLLQLPAGHSVRPRVALTRGIVLVPVGEVTRAVFGMKRFLLVWPQA